MTGHNGPFSTEALDALIDDICSDRSSVRTNIRAPHPDTDKLLEYARGKDAPSISQQVQRHVSGCQECASRINEFKLTAQAWEGPDGEERLEKIRRRLRQARQEEFVFVAERNGGLTPDSYSSGEGIAEGAERKARERMVRKLLHEARAIERDCDYILPNGLHSEIHVNLGRICESERTLASIVGALDEMLRGQNFDTLVSTSWALATIARRLIWGRADGRFRRIQHVRVEGYDPPCILEAVPPGANAILLVDVVVTGTQIVRVTEELKRQNAASVKAIAIVDAEFAGKRVAGPFEALCRKSFNMAPAGECPRCDKLPRAEWNPFLGGMTIKKLKPRSPSEFLGQDSVARQFWEFVERAGAFEHHRRIGRRHYLGFIDTARLLGNKVTGRAIVKNLCQEIFERSGFPDTVLVPDRAKSLLLGRCLVEGFKHLGKGGVCLASVRRRPRHFTTTGLPDLSGQRVLIADAAAGHGDTLDELALLSSSGGAVSIAGAVLLSRMSEACEQAFDKRLSAGFTKLYSMPVRPITERDKIPVRCSVCLRREDLKKAVGELPEGTVKEVAKKLIPTIPRFSRRTEKATSHERQTALFAPHPLQSYRPSVASGIALHALHAAMGDGMAPLSLPEIASQDISVARRAALVADLPAGVLKWSGPPLVEEFCQFLRKGVDKRVWIAIVELMARSESTAWVDSLNDAITNAKAHENWMDELFWARMNLIVDRLVRHTPGISEQLRQPLEMLVHAYDRETPAQRGLNAMLDTAYQFSGKYEAH